jgi:hypothetical protein
LSRSGKLPCSLHHRCAPKCGMCRRWLCLKEESALAHQIRFPFGAGRRDSGRETPALARLVCVPKADHNYKMRLWFSRPAGSKGGLMPNIAH